MPCKMGFFRNSKNCDLKQAINGKRKTKRRIKEQRIREQRRRISFTEEKGEMRVKEESEEAGLILGTFKKLRSWHLVPSLHGR